jgi:hypothetical protein
MVQFDFPEVWHCEPECGKLDVCQGQALLTLLGLKGLLRKATARFAERYFAIQERSAKNREIKFQTCIPSTYMMNTRLSFQGIPA